MNNYDLMKFAEFFDEDLKPSDFTVEELNDIIKSKMKMNAKFREKYFDFYDDIKCPTNITEDW